MPHRVFFHCASVCLLAVFVGTTAQAATDHVRTYLIDDIVLPQFNSEYAIDVDGDGFVENDLGKILGALSGQGLDYQGAMNAAVASGSIVHLVRLQTTDAHVANDPAAQVTWCIGAPTATPPLFDGTDDASCDDTSGIFVAALSGGTFISAVPATTANPVALDLKLTFGASAFVLPVWNARLSFTTDAAGDLQLGQINGSVPNTDFRNGFAQGLASDCNASIQSDPSSGNAMACEQIFDLGCEGFPAYAQDSEIELCEALESSLIKALLAPDVQVADGDNLVDANSIGVRFTAIANDRVFANGFEP